MNPTPEAVEAALALVDAGPATDQDTLEARLNMIMRCDGGEDVNQAAARILAAEVRGLRAAARDAEQAHERELTPRPRRHTKKAESSVLRTRRELLARLEEIDRVKPA